MSSSDDALHELVAAIIVGDSAELSERLASAPDLARASFAMGATRNREEGFFLDSIKRWIIRGDTALHFAAAACNLDAVNVLIAAGADVHSRNRHGHTPLQSAAVGPAWSVWNSEAQAATITALIDAGADPNATDKRGVAALHVAVRTRRAAAVRALLEHGADPARPNGNGSTPMLLAKLNTGRGGSGSPEAKAQQEEIVRVLQESLHKAR